MKLRKSLNGVEFYFASELYKMRSVKVLVLTVLNYFHTDLTMKQMSLTSNQKKGENFIAGDCTTFFFWTEFKHVYNFLEFDSVINIADRVCLIIPVIDHW